MTINKNNTYDLIILLPLIIVSYLSTIDNFALQTAVDGGLIISDKINYPDDFKNVTSIYFNGWTFLHHITLILLKININVILISKILMFISVIFLTFGIFYLVKGITKSNIFSLIISLTVIITKINFGSLDYPAFFFTEHTYGMFSLSTFALIAGLLSNRNFKLAGFFTVLLTSFHLVVGLWLIFLMIFLLFYLDKFLKQKNTILFQDFKKGSFIALVPIFLSLIFFQLNTIEKNLYSANDFEVYLKIWDHHRSLLDINYSYIFKTIILILLYFYVFFKILKNDKNESFLFYFIFFNCLGSMLVYLIYKFFPSLMPEIIIRAMPTRVFLLHSIIGYPIIASLLFVLFFNKVKMILTKKNFIIFSLFSLFLFSLISVFKYDEIKNTKDKYYPKIIKRINKFEKNLSNKLDPDEEIFWNKVKKYETDGYFVTTFYSSEMTLKFANKPYIINANFFDHLPYHPYTVDEVKIILENIYGIDFNNPPEKNRPEIKDKWIKEIFESRPNDIWQKLSKDFNLSGVIVPQSWNLNIKKKFSSNIYSFYVF